MPGYGLLDFNLAVLKMFPFDSCFPAFGEEGERGSNLAVVIITLILLFFF